MYRKLWFLIVDQQKSNHLKVIQYENTFLTFHKWIKRTNTISDVQIIDFWWLLSEGTGNDLALTCYASPYLSYRQLNWYDWVPLWHSADLVFVKLNKAPIFKQDVRWEMKFTCIEYSKRSFLKDIAFNSKFLC